MRKYLSSLFIAATFIFLVCTVYAKATADMASEIMIPHDPNKKKAGEECKTSDECQKHHECVKTEEKGICTAPPRPKLPPNAVT